ncbi:MAG: flagellar basal body P-ring protein FlgI [Candidatus Kapaibacterium sp.]
MNNRSLHIALISAIAAAVLLLISLVPAKAARIKDIAEIRGNADRQVIGYGLVTGLNQTGDNQMTSYTVQSVSNMLKRFGLTIPERNPRIRNVAAVMVTAVIPAFTGAGSKVDVQVSSIGDATSLQGGILLMTPLSFADGSIVGFAQGAVSVGGFDYRALGTRISKNIATTGRVPNGLILDTEIPGTYMEGNVLNILLRDPDFTTAGRVAAAINAAPGLANTAQALDAGTVQVTFPAGSDQQAVMAFITTIESLNVISDPVARVVINERTGTIVIGGNVELLPVTISHGGLEISVQRQVIVPQPAPFTIRPPQPVETAEIEVEEEINPARPLEVPGPTVQDMAEALNLLEVKPRDLIAIFQALKEAGALQGELIIQ